MDTSRSFFFEILSIDVQESEAPLIHTGQVDMLTVKDAAEMSFPVLTMAAANQVLALSR